MVYFDCFAQAFCSLFGTATGVLLFVYILLLYFRKDFPEMKGIFWEFVNYWNEKKKLKKDEKNG